MNARKQTGFTATELLITMAIIGLLTTLAVPAVGDYFDRKRLVAAAEATRDELQFARFEALSMSSNVRVATAGGVSVHFDRVADNDWRIGTSVNTGCDPRERDLTDADACYIISDDGDGTVDGVDVNFNGVLDAAEQDDGDRVLKVLNGADFPGVSMSTAAAFNPGAAAEITFDPVRGTTVGNRTGSVRFQAKNGHEIQVNVNALGRVKLCSDDVPGYPDC